MAAPKPKASNAQRARHVDANGGAIIADILTPCAKPLGLVLQSLALEE